MTHKAKAKSRILKAVHDTASDLHRLGFIGKRKMQKYDAVKRAVDNKYIGSSFDNFLEADGLLDNVQAAAIKRVALTGD